MYTKTDFVFYSYLHFHQDVAKAEGSHLWSWSLLYDVVLWKFNYSYVPAFHFFWSSGYRFICDILFVPGGRCCVRRNLKRLVCFSWNEIMFTNKCILQCSYNRVFVYLMLKRSPGLVKGPSSLLYVAWTNFVQRRFVNWDWIVQEKSIMNSQISAAYSIRLQLILFLSIIYYWFWLQNCCYRNIPD